MAGVVVHEWLAPRGGSENVVEAMLRSFPDAAIWTLWNDAPHRFDQQRLHESWLARTPLRRSKAAALPLMPATWQRARFDGADFVLISSHAFAHHADWRNRSQLRRLVYVHTPARYVWAPEMDGRGRNPVARAASPYLKRLDRRVAQSQEASFAANSQFVRERIQDSWGVESRVIHPPVDVARIQAVADWRQRLSPAEAAVVAALPEGFILGASRFVSYKRLELVIRAGEAAGMPVVLAGGGPLRDRLMQQGSAAAVPVTIVDAPSDALLYALYQRAAIFGFFAVEDFGIMPVEAIALGTPALVVSAGGAKESVLATAGGAVLDVRETGALEPDALRDGVERALRADLTTARRRARELFDESRFAARLQEWVLPAPATAVGVARAGR